MGLGRGLQHRGHELLKVQARLFKVEGTLGGPFGEHHLIAALVPALQGAIGDGMEVNDIDVFRFEIGVIDFAVLPEFVPLGLGLRLGLGERGRG